MANIYYVSYHLFEMVTRGVYGYRINGKDKVTYNHCDSYPDVLGARILEYASRMGVGRMRTASERIRMVNKDDTAKHDLVGRYCFYADLNMDASKYEKWYCLLRNVQGNLYPYHTRLEHMIDASVFLADSFLCRWAYIINLDEKCFEIYKGSNSDPKAAGRYAWLHREDSDGYHGVKLISVLPLPGFQEKFIPQIVQFLNAYEEVDNQY